MEYPSFSSEELALEEWRPVLDFEGVYSVSNLGRVRRDLGGERRVAGRILKPRKAGKGYRKVTLCHDGLQRARYIHVIVARAFIGPCPDGQEVNHKDAVKANCRASNLEYRTRQGNVDHARTLGLTPHGERCGLAKLTAPQVAYVRQRYNGGGITQRALASELDVTQSLISCIVREKCWRGLSVAPRS